MPHIAENEMTRQTRPERQSERSDGLDRSRPSQTPRVPPPPARASRPHHLVGRERSRTVRWGLALVAYLVVLAGVVLLGFAVVNQWTRQGDIFYERNLQATHNVALYVLLDGISAIGYPLEAGIIAAAIIAIFWVLRMRLEALFLALSLLADAVALWLKHAVGRSRPSPDIVHVVLHLTTASFPSGHTVHYTAFYGMLIVVMLARIKPTLGRNLWLGLFALLIILVGPSRVYLGEHWPSDVLAGYIIGFLVLVPIALAYAWMRANPRRIPHTGWLYPDALVAPGPAR